MKGTCCFCKVADEVVDRSWAFSATAAARARGDVAEQVEAARAALWADDRATLCVYCATRFMGQKLPAVTS